jgi:hypothetical protein
VEFAYSFPILLSSSGKGVGSLIGGMLYNIYGGESHDQADADWIVIRGLPRPPMLYTLSASRWVATHREVVF